MKKVHLLVLSVALLVTSCSKDDSPQPSTTAVGNGNQEISIPPGILTQKVLLEYHTAAWCGSCPDADTKRDQVMAAYPGKIVPVAIHQSDAMQIPGFFTIDATFGSSPAFGMVNRIPSLNTVLLNRTQWLTNASSAVSRNAVCGLAIMSTVAGSAAAIEVQAAFLTGLSGTYNVSVYLTESEVTGTGSTFDQVNSYNTDPTSQWYNLGNPITGFKHMYVWRKNITPVLGDQIPTVFLIEGGLFKKVYTVDISGFNKDKLNVVAFINKVGTTATTHEVMNVQTAPIGTLKNWD
ncbi:MAG TPA: Omp28-related outer membrane protein [Bacteroidia bacterium]|nr:Omp28-related outer membrane protein [Bacteroidia bacterium]